MPAITAERPGSQHCSRPSRPGSAVAACTWVRRRPGGHATGQPRAQPHGAEPATINAVPPAANGGRRARHPGHCIAPPDLRGYL